MTFPRPKQICLICKTFPGLECKFQIPRLSMTFPWPGEPCIQINVVENAFPSEMHFEFRYFVSWFCGSLRKQPTFHEVATWALAKRRLSNERRNSLLMTFTIQILVELLIGWKKIPTNQTIFIGWLATMRIPLSWFFYSWAREASFFVSAVSRPFRTQICAVLVSLVG